MAMNNLRIDSVWDLLVARIAALEARVLTLENGTEHDGWLDPADLRDGICAALDEEDPDEFWIGGTDGPDD